MIITIIDCILNLPLTFRVFLFTIKLVISAGIEMKIVMPNPINCPQPSVSLRLKRYPPNIRLQKATIASGVRCFITLFIFIQLETAFLLLRPPPLHYLRRS